jgi:hypothetical protein
MCKLSSEPFELPATESAAPRQMRRRIWHRDKSSNLNRIHNLPVAFIFSDVSRYRKDFTNDVFPHSMSVSHI